MPNPKENAPDWNPKAKSPKRVIESLSQLEAWAAEQQRDAERARDLAENSVALCGDLQAGTGPQFTVPKTQTDVDKPIVSLSAGHPLIVRPTSSGPSGRAHAVTTSLQDCLVQKLLDGRNEVHLLLERVSKLESFMQEYVKEIRTTLDGRTNVLQERVSQLEEAQSHMQKCVQEIHEKMDGVHMSIRAAQENATEVIDVDQDMATPMVTEVDKKIQFVGREVESTPMALVKLESDMWTFAQLESRVAQLESKAVVVDTRDTSGYERSGSASLTPPTDEPLDRSSISTTHARRVAAAKNFNGFRHSAVRTAVLENLTNLLDDSMRSTLENSVWELSIVAGSTGVPLVETIIAICLLSLNVFLQALVCVILMNHFLKDDNLGADRWRFEVGHWEKFATQSGRSMTDRLCDGDASLELSGTQQIEFEEVKGWLKAFAGLNQGMALVLWCLLVWFLFIWQEMQKACDRISCIIDVPRDLVTHIYPTEQGFIICSMSLGRKAVTIFVNMLRVGVAASICFAGTVWLAQTDDIEELMLNAVALVFALDIDEVLFQTSCSNHLRVLVQNVEPLPFPKFVKKTRVPVRSCLTIGACVIFLVSAHAYRLETQKNKLFNIREDFCGGRTDFMVGVNKVTDIVFMYDGPGKDELTLMRNVAKDIVKSVPNTAHVVTNSLNQFEDLVTMDLDRSIEVMGKCADMHSNEIFLLAPLQYAANRYASSCQDLTTAQCMDLKAIVRLACPVKCLCDKPLAGFYVIQGCPMEQCAAMKGYEDLLQNARTEDTHIDILNQMPEWDGYWQGYEKLMNDNPLANNIRADPADIEMAFRSMGCEAMWHLSNVWNVSATLLQYSFCDENNLRRPLKPWCPESCGCSTRSASDKFCPKPVEAHGIGCASVHVRNAHGRGGPAPTIATSQCNQTVLSNLTHPLGSYVCQPYGYNGKHLYLLTDLSGETWSIKWETVDNLDWGPKYLGSAIGQGNMSKWTLSSIKSSPALGQYKTASRWFTSNANSNNNDFPPHHGWLPRNVSNSDADCAWHEIQVEGGADFVTAQLGATSCPLGYSHINTTSRCMEAAARLDFGIGGTIKTDGEPPGCYAKFVTWSRTVVHFNIDPIGWPRASCAKICQEGGQVHL